jgi:hypothetical protein
MNGFIGAATLIVTVVGLWLAYNYRRQMALKLSETRLDAYSRLWAITGVAAPTRLDGWGDDGYLQLDERRELWASMTDWYYANGGGMLLTAVTKEVYLNVKRNLVCEWSELCPAHLAARIELPADHELVDKVRGILAIKLISLLRTQLKCDLTIYGPTYAGKLNNYERFFLEQSGVNLRSRAWAKAAGYSWWERLPLVRTVAGRLPRGKPQDFTEPGLPQPSPLLGRSAVLDVGEACRTPASSRIAMENALRSGSAGSAGARGGIPEVHSDDRDASIGLNTLP